jgi:hypothetical protein
MKPHAIFVSVWASVSFQSRGSLVFLKFCIFQILVSSTRHYSQFNISAMCGEWPQNMLKAWLQSLLYALSASRKPVIKGITLITRWCPFLDKTLSHYYPHYLTGHLSPLQTHPLTDWPHKQQQQHI